MQAGSCGQCLGFIPGRQNEDSAVERPHFSCDLKDLEACVVNCEHLQRIPELVQWKLRCLQDHADVLGPAAVARESARAHATHVWTSAALVDQAACMSSSAQRPNAQAQGGGTCQEAGSVHERKTRLVRRLNLLLRRRGMNAFPALAFAQSFRILPRLNLLRNRG